MTGTPESAEAPAPAPPVAQVQEPPVDPVPAAPAESGERPAGLGGRIRALRERYPRTEIALFFFLGFAYTLLTLGRIDDWGLLSRHGAYLCVLGLLLLVELRGGRLERPAWLARVWRYREEIIHFLLGNLLSAYTLFFFKSASGLTSLLFMVGLFGLLVANDLPRFRARGPVVRVALYSLCLTCYLTCVLPVAAGRLSAEQFTWAVGLASVGVGAGFVLAWGGRGEVRAVARRVLAPGLGVQVALLLLNGLRVIPPVPLAVQASGIYHGVERVGREYRLQHERPWWRVWHRGDQDFRARAGDRVYYFVRIFAPTHFREQVVVRWYYEEPEQGWVERGRTRLGIQGGREQGFRTYAYKAHYEPGEWRVSVETEDGREIGRLDFTVRPDERQGERAFQVDRG